MITIREVHKHFGSQTLFEGASLQINQGDRFALVGPNGAGKSTLFRMLLGEQQPDSGEIDMRRGMAVGYLPQENPPLEGGKIIDEALAHHADPDGKITAKAKSVLMGLGFKVTDFERDVSTLSGGWAMRVAMARLLLQEPDLLMLDEPTNHLDLESLFWFQEYLQYYPGAIFLISHDRAFINALCQGIVSVQDKTLKVYTGNYDAYLSERASERERLESAYRRQQEEIAEMQDFISRNRARASTASRAQSMMKRLEKLERIELPRRHAPSRSASLSPSAPESARMKSLTINYSILQWT
jgi:ATP-binding cassette subfamily F protein 3